jgi:hypothetical protein
MRFGVTSATTCALAIAVLLGVVTAPPLAAGPACNELDLSSPCISGNDIRPNLTLGGPTGNARLQLRDAAGAQGVQLQATTGNVLNRFANAAARSNGLVKAWAEINPDGTIAACWRCSTDPADTGSIGTGLYEVDFTPLDTDISGRPRSGTIDGGASVAGMIGLADRFGDPSSVFVVTRNTANAAANLAFVLLIY